MPEGEGEGNRTGGSGGEGTAMTRIRTATATAGRAAEAAWRIGQLYCALIDSFPQKSLIVYPPWQLALAVYEALLIVSV